MSEGPGRGCVGEGTQEEPSIRIPIKEYLSLKNASKQLEGFLWGFEHPNVITKEWLEQKRKIENLQERNRTKSETIERLIKQNKAQVIEILDYKKTIEDLKQKVKEAQKIQKANEDEKESLKAQIIGLQELTFARKSEKMRGSESTAPKCPGSKRKRGQQSGARGHGRTKVIGLPFVHEVIELKDPRCPNCHTPYEPMSGTRDSEATGISIVLFNKLFHRKRYRRVCNCEGSKIIVAPPAPKVIAKTKYLDSIWVHFLLHKFEHGMPLNRIIESLDGLGLRISIGTVCGGFQKLCELLECVHKALLDKLSSCKHFHGDETRWQVLRKSIEELTRYYEQAIEQESESEAKTDTKTKTETESGTEAKKVKAHDDFDDQAVTKDNWWLWVFTSQEVAYYVVAPSRGSEVLFKTFNVDQQGVRLSCDRWSAYKKFAKDQPELTLAFCWAHQRRDWIKLSKSYPKLNAVAQEWIEKVNQLYHLQRLRSQAQMGSQEFNQIQEQLRAEVKKMAELRDKMLADQSTHKAVQKVLQSLKNHWEGYMIFVDDPTIPMDNNRAESGLRGSVVGRNNFNFSGAYWSAQLAARMYSLIETLKLWGLSRQKWFLEYFNACALNGGKAPDDLTPFLPWEMDEQRRKHFSSYPEKIPPALKARERNQAFEQFQKAKNANNDQCPDACGCAQGLELIEPQATALELTQDDINEQTGPCQISNCGCDPSPLDCSQATQGSMNPLHCRFGPELEPLLPQPLPDPMPDYQVLCAISDSKVDKSEQDCSQTTQGSVDSPHCELEPQLVPQLPQPPPAALAQYRGSCEVSDSDVDQSAHHCFEATLGTVDSPPSGFEPQLQPLLPQPLPATLPDQALPSDNPFSDLEKASENLPAATQCDQTLLSNGDVIAPAVSANPARRTEFVHVSSCSGHSALCGQAFFENSLDVDAAPCVDKSPVMSTGPPS